jgi:uncharacterized protein with HEPN domain
MADSIRHSERQTKAKTLFRSEMYLLRIKMSHEYFGIDYEIIRDIATNYLPENRKQIEEILPYLQR